MAELRRDRDRRRPGRLRGRDPRRPARPEDRGRRARQARRPLPELRLHPREDRPAHRRGLRRGGRERRRARASRPPASRSTGRRSRPPREGLEDPRRTGSQMLWKKNKVDFLAGEASLAGGRQGQGGQGHPRGEGDRPRDRLGGDADPRHRLLRPRHRHLGRLVARPRCRRRWWSPAPAPPAPRSRPPTPGWGSR